MIFKNFADQDWIGFNFIKSGLDSDWKISQSAHLCLLPPQGRVPTFGNLSLDWEFYQRLGKTLGIWGNWDLFREIAHLVIKQGKFVVAHFHMMWNRDCYFDINFSSRIQSTKCSRTSLAQSLWSSVSRLQFLNLLYQRWALDWIRARANFVKFGLDPVSSEIPDLRNFWLHVMYTCTE